VKGKGRTSKKLAALVEAYKGQAKLNATEAARLAGYRNPATVAWGLKRKYPEVFAEAEREFREKFKLTDDELDEIPASIARNTQESPQNRLKAVELIGRMKGKFSDKVTINVTRSELQKQLDEALASIAQLTPTLKAVQTPEDVKELLDSLSSVSDSASTDLVKQ
jgi:sugar-specific transcriptional regulator TrmB